MVLADRHLSRLYKEPMYRLTVLLLAFASLAFGQDIPSSQPQSPTPGRPIPNKTVPKPPNASGASTPSSGQSGAAASQAGQDSNTPTFKVNVKLVTVYASVQDEHGAPVANLKEDDFRVLEDGHPEKIALFQKESEMPLSIVVEVDTSGSTKKDLKLELASAREFAKDILRPVDKLSVYSFNEEVNEVVPFTSDIKQIDHGLNQVQPGSATAMYDAIYLGSKALMKRQGRKVMVLITDGGDTYSSTTYQDALRAATQAEVLVYSIIMVPVEQSAGRDTGGEHALIQISKDTGGKHYYAKDLSQLDAAFKKISEELRTQYLIGYYPSRRFTSNDFRRIEIELTHAGKFSTTDKVLYVHHRTGYYTSPLE